MLGTHTELMRNNRIELRTTPNEKELLTRAASIEHLDLTSFIMRTVVPTAREVVKRTERLELSERDTLLVLNLLENPPKANSKLKAAAKSWYINQSK